jgi:hypothetical protein
MAGVYIRFSIGVLHDNKMWMENVAGFDRLVTDNLVVVRDGVTR